jgi:phytoene synthase
LVAGIHTDHCLEQVRRHDRDRYLTALFAPPERRAGLLALYALNLELGQVSALAREPILGRVRLQWWRERIERLGQERPAHPVLAALPATGLAPEAFLRLVEAWETELSLERPVDLPALLDYAETVSAPPMWLALETLGGPLSEPAQESGRAIATAWALTGVLRSLPSQARTGRCYLPEEIERRPGVEDWRLPSPALSRAVAEIADRAWTGLRAGREAGRGLPRRLIPALLPATLAEIYLRRLERAGFDPYSAGLSEAPAGRVWRLAVRAWTGRY